MNYRDLTPKDSGLIASLHLKSFKGFLLSKLGFKFLNIFYESILKNNDCIGIGVFENNLLIGFAIGSKNKNNFYKRILIENFVSFLKIILVSSIFKPILLLRLLVSFKSSSNNDMNNELNSAILLSICIDPSKESKGIGRSLLIKFEDSVFKHVQSIILTTDAVNNSGVNNFYVKNKYELCNSFFQGNRLMNRYIKKKT